MNMNWLTLATATEGGGVASGGMDGSVIGNLDIAVIVIYLLVVVGLGCFVGMWKNRKGGGDAKSYFLAGGTLRWPIIGLALFATNISCVHLVSLAQSGYDTGLLNGNYEWMAALTLVMLGVFFAPFYIRSKVATLPDFLERRYNRACRDWLAVLSMVSAVTIHIGFSFLTGGKVLEALFGINIYYSIVVIAALTGLYTIVGGLMAVVVTEAIQTVILVLGAMLISWFAWDKMGGWDAMTTVLETKNALGTDNVDKLSMLRPAGESAHGLPWYAVFLGYPIIGIWYWCADQTIVQRVLGAKSEEHARVGPIFAGLIKILPVFIFVMPGLFAFTLAQSGKLDTSSLVQKGQYNLTVALGMEELTLPNEKALVDGKVYDAKTHVLNLDKAEEAKLIDATMATLIRENKNVEPVIDSKGIYGIMITQLMPVGLVGVMIAALLAALMSTVSGALNSISTLFSYDLYKRFKPDTSDAQLVLIGRVVAFLALVVAIGLVPLLDNYKSIFDGLNDIICHIAPPVTCVFLLGIFWPSASATSAKLTLWFGSTLGMVVFLIGKLAGDSAIGKMLTTISTNSFMMKAFYLFCVCVTMQVVFTMIWPAGESERSSKLYWEHPLEPLKDKGWPGIGNYKFLSCLLLGVMAVLYYFFR